MNECKRCGSKAINHHLHGRKGDLTDLCDVCYWRHQHDVLQIKIREILMKYDITNGK